MMVSVPPVALASMIASRKLQPASAAAQAPGVRTSLVVLTVNVGSGMGITIVGTTSPRCNAMIPGRPSTLRRIGKALIGDPEYGFTETCPGRNVLAPGCASGWEITTICPVAALSHMMSSAPLLEIRVRKNTGVFFNETPATE